MGHQRGKDIISNAEQLVPAGDAFVAGFPCTDTSSLNMYARSSENRSCVQSMSLRTGSVFNGLIQYLGKVQARMSVAVFENVLGLAVPRRDRKTRKQLGPSNLQVCIGKLRSKGFHARALKLCPSLFGVPQLRPRLYFPAFYTSKLRGQNVATEDADRILAGAVQRFIGSAAQNIDEYLLVEQDKKIQCEYTRLRLCADVQTAETALALAQHQAPKRRKMNDKKLTQKWMNVAVDKSDEWWLNPFSDPEILRDYPGLLALGDRELELLRHHRIDIPDLQAARTIDTSQTALRTRPSKAGRSYCLTPKARMYLTHRCRFVHGMEALRLQNVWYGSHAEDELLRMFGNATLFDMAGNAMEGCCLSCVIMASVCVLSAGHNSDRAVPRSLCSRSCTDSDSEAEEHVFHPLPHFGNADLISDH